jgi:hypothetical protein
LAFIFILATGREIIKKLTASVQKEDGSHERRHSDLGNNIITIVLFLNA